VVKVAVNNLPETKSATEPVDDEMLVIDLQNPAVAAVLAWLIPGAGHLYQRRTAKGILFLVCILGTFFYGLFLGGGRVVYASWRPDDHRWPYLCQVGVGLPAMPALVQAYRSANLPSNQLPPPPGFMAPPRMPMSVPIHENRELAEWEKVGDLGVWEKELNRYFELGTVFTMIAGLLNILAIYDAWGGPMQFEPAPGKEGDKNRAPERKPPGS
jgi:hypothetical protein